MTEIRFVIAFFEAKIRAAVARTRDDDYDGDRGDVVQWVIITGLLAAAAIAIIAIVVNKARDRANLIQTQ